MAGKLPIDRARARKDTARPYEQNKQTFAEDQVRLDRVGRPQPDQPEDRAAEAEGNERTDE